MLDRGDVAGCDVLKGCGFPYGGGQIPAARLQVGSKLILLGLVVRSGEGLGHFR